MSKPTISTSHLMGQGVTISDRSQTDKLEPSTPTLGQIVISPTTCLPRNISQYSLASLTEEVTPIPSVVKKQLLRQLDSSIINFPSVSQSPTIPNESNISPNNINFPKGKCYIKLKKNFFLFLNLKLILLFNLKSERFSNSSYFDTTTNATTYQ